MRIRPFVWILGLLVLASFASALLGSGTLSDPYQIYNCTDLNRTRDNLYANYSLMEDIDCTDTKNWDGGLGWARIGNVVPEFIGNFDGRGHAIINLTINRSAESYLGLFGQSSGTINNTGLINVNISGNQYIGAIAGWQGGSIINSYSTGSVSGGPNGYIGGLVGYGTGQIISSYSTAIIISEDGLAGGLAGEYDGLITDSYSLGTISGGDMVGGLAGGSVGGSFINSYSAGLVSGSSNTGGSVGYIEGGATCTDSFWDNETSNQTTTACGASPKTNVEMKNTSTFISAGWDFAQNWTISNILNQGYPYLQWNDFGTYYSSFGAGTTDFDSVPNKNNVTNAKLAKSGSVIAWNNGVNANGADFDSYAALGSGFVSINASKFDSTINTSVNVTFQTQSCNGLQLYYAPSYYTTLADIIANGQLCNGGTTPACTNIVCVQGAASASVTFTIPHLDGIGGSSGAVPEFSTFTSMLALAIIISGIFIIRKKRLN